MSMVQAPPTSVTKLRQLDRQGEPFGHLPVQLVLPFHSTKQLLQLCDLLIGDLPALLRAGEHALRVSDEL